MLDGVSCETFLCSRCGGAREREGYRYCRRCDAAYRRSYRQLVAGRKAALKAKAMDRLAAKWLSEGRK